MAGPVAVVYIAAGGNEGLADRRAAAERRVEEGRLLPSCTQQLKTDEYIVHH